VVKRSVAGWLALSAILLVLFAFAIANAGSQTIYAQEPPPVTPQPAQPDGSIIHEVRQGDTLFGITLAYKVDFDELRRLNDFPDTLSVGQRIIVKLAPTPTIPANATILVVTSGPSPTATVEGAVAPTETPVPSVTPTPSEVPPSPVPTVAPISNKALVCITAFEDVNTNHWRDVDEKPLKSVELKLVEVAGTEQKLTTTTDDSVCFTEVADGLYSVSAVAPAGYGLTTAGLLEVDIKAGAKLALQFGAAQGYQPATAEAATPSPILEATKAPGATTDTIVNTVFGNSGVIVLALAALVLIGGIAVVTLARRR
jgi:hypothetical protein